MFKNLEKLWKKHGFLVMLIGTILFFLIYYLFCRGRKGTWSNEIFLLDGLKERENKPKPRGDSKGEVECRRVLEKLFGCKFPKCRPDFLRNEVTGHFNLELDCYSDKYKIACEYNGQQHYKYTPFYHKNKEAFYNQKYRDYIKRDLCKKNGIMLIEVPYTVGVGEIESYIEKELERLRKG